MYGYMLLFLDENDPGKKKTLASILHITPKKKNTNEKVSSLCYPALSCHTPSHTRHLLVDVRCQDRKGSHPCFTVLAETPPLISVF